MFKKSFCLLFVLLAACTPFSAFAENEASAFLSSVTTEKNMLFETTLSVNAEVAAFVATLEFDESKVEFRGATPLSEASEISVNSSEKGKVTLAFLSEYGIKGEVIGFTFKAKSKSTFIALKLEQIIDKNGEDLELKKVSGANVTITAKSADKAEAQNKPSPNSPETTVSASKTKGTLSIMIPSDDDADYPALLSIFTGSALLIAAGVTGFILSRNSGSKKQNRKNNYEKNT